MPPLLVLAEATTAQSSSCNGASSACKTCGMCSERENCSIRTLAEVTRMGAYSGKAQPYLDAIAHGVFQSQAARDWLIKDTPAASAYTGSGALVDEQRSVRWQSQPTKQPFWANYWCGLDSACTCRIEGSKGLESDAIFFLRNDFARTLAVHVEFKHPNEPFGFGQPEAYPLRAACFAEGRHPRSTLNAHHDWATVLFCGPEALADSRLSCFQRVITHDEARWMLPGYP